jgi:hypothetical protein
LAGWAWAKDYKLIDGSSVIGEVSAFDDNGAVFRLTTGGFSKRISWTKFSQEALKDLASDAKIKPLVEPFIEIPLQPKPKPKPITPVDPPRVERPVGKSTIFSSVTSPLGLAVVVLLYLANLFAGYEIAVYRNRPIPMVCGLAAVLPILGPLFFLASPTVPSAEGEGFEAAELEAGMPAPGMPAAGSPGGATSRRVVAAKPAGLRVAAQEKAVAGKVEPKIFKRGEYTFNRRFIETQFSGFFRIVPLESEKDLVLIVRTPKREYVARRIARISFNEMFVQLLQDSTKEVNIEFAEIEQMQIRHVDDLNKD